MGEYITISYHLFFLIVGQVKFDPPLRKETEPHHEFVSNATILDFFSKICEW